jgi:cysteine desulfurase
LPEIYLDNAATTRPYPEVVEAVIHAMSDGFGNASSLHGRGVRAMRLIEEARQAVAGLVDGAAWKVVFTSGGSEADSLAVFSAQRGKRDVLLVGALEHAAVRESAQAAGEKGAVIRELPLPQTGVLDPHAVAGLIDERTALLCIPHVAPELGTVQPVRALSKAAKAVSGKIRVHVDAVQAAAQLPRLNYSSEVDSVALSAHKLHGPQGVGALLLRPGVSLRPLVRGGDQEDGLRPGTYNLPGIVGFGVAARIWAQHRAQASAQMARLTERLVGSVLAAVEGVRLLGDPTARAPGMAVLAASGVRSEVLLHALEAKGVLAASSSACHSRRKEPPASLVAAGLLASEGAVRFSLSEHTTLQEVELTVIAFESAVEESRGGGVARP